MSPRWIQLRTAALEQELQALQAEAGKAAERADITAQAAAGLATLTGDPEVQVAKLSGLRDLD